MGLISNFLGAGQDKLVKKYQKKVERINDMEPEIVKMSDEDICKEIKELGHRMRGGEDANDHLLRVYALAREHIKRTTGKRAYDVQLIGAMALNDGHIAELATGQGKTLTSNFPILLNALAGRQVHVVTVNEYLSGRDADLCREALAGTGVTVGYIYNQQPKDSKKEAYACDIVYGTPSEFGFDYLRDNTELEPGAKMQTKHDYAIIDEIDSILIDEARTPLILSGASNEDTVIYKAFEVAVRMFRRGVHYEADEAKKTVAITEQGLRMVEKNLGIDDLYSEEYGGQLPKYLQKAVLARALYKKDRDYIVEDGEVKIVDPNTGRVMEGRRWSEGLHQAIEAKEGVEIQKENETMATVTLQNFFRLYDKLSGCTGTAMTEDAEFRKTYNMGVVAVPPAQPVIRQDMPDVVYKNTEAKFNAIIDEIEECHARQQPVLVGTVSVANSERLSAMLTKRGIDHFTLNAKNHAKEAHIIAQAGRAGAVTIATNMAGRGTDIMLGGNPDELLESYKAAVIARREPDPETGKVDTFIPQAELDEARRQLGEACKREQEIVLEAGGLAVIGSERHESRRIDNQLRGRSGRQGDPGKSQFYISLEDDLMRLFGQDRMDAIKTFLDKGGLDDDVPLDAPILSKSIERAQRQVESMHYDARKSTLDYDDVLNKQRLAIYSERDLLLSDEGDIWGRLSSVAEDAVADLVYESCDLGMEADKWDWDTLRKSFEVLSGMPEADTSFIGFGKSGMSDLDEIQLTMMKHLQAAWQKYTDALGEEKFDGIARKAMLTSIDTAWRDHLKYMDYLKNGIGMRSYGQRDPLTEYKDEAYKAFEFSVETMYIPAIANILQTAEANLRFNITTAARNAIESGALDSILGEQGGADQKATQKAEQTKTTSKTNPLMRGNIAIPGSKAKQNKKSNAPTGAAPIEQVKEKQQAQQQSKQKQVKTTKAKKAKQKEPIKVDDHDVLGGLDDELGSAIIIDNAGLGDADIIE